MLQFKNNWDNETGIATTTIIYNNKKFIGQAKCHPEDKDMQSSWTGTAISEFRASILVLQHIRDNELRPQLKCLKQLYYSMNRSKHFNPKSYEAKMLMHSIKNAEIALEEIKKTIAITKNELNHYLNTKELWYQQIRKRRAGQDKTTLSK